MAYCENLQQEPFPQNKTKPKTMTANCVNIFSSSFLHKAYQTIHNNLRHLDHYGPLYMLIEFDKCESLPLLYLINKKFYSHLNIISIDAITKWQMMRGLKAITNF
jgi:hypothetical protein